MKFQTSKKVDELVGLFSDLREKSIKSGEKVENIRWEFLREVYSIPQPWKTGDSFNRNKIVWLIALPTLVVVLGLFLMDSDLDFSAPCLINTETLLLNDITRKPSDCSLMCEGVEEVPRISNLSKEEFIATYAYSARPLIITDAAKNWSAVGKFSFRFFKHLYAKNKEAAEENPDLGCIFFPYGSGFNSLREALKMSKKRAEWRGKPWYIGWSNCDPIVRDELRKYYSKPGFIPDDAETGDQDWIFMGGPGPGAPIHLDMVQRPSWQAQLSGQKIWTLVPPPECEHICRSLQVTVTKGDIIVLDTNQWFHSTKVVPTGELSITIGAEYD
ncbi:bifunctional arginine demethylase and lysyl-hydroxylase JMJD6-like [Acropora muricata]|uniref:bifunctional arginine demethylase and lysyl-hydroxylase JMJD6-like n=1 Tax=Acropora muricata TaxID=159855 RepID=UPI0034E514E6